MFSSHLDSVSKKRGLKLKVRLWDCGTRPNVYGFITIHRHGVTNNNQTKEETCLTGLSLMYVSAWEFVCDLILLTLLNAEIQQAPRKRNI